MRWFGKKVCWLLLAALPLEILGCAHILHLTTWLKHNSQRRWVFSAVDGVTPPVGKAFLLGDKCSSGVGLCPPGVPLVPLALRARQKIPSSNLSQIQSIRSKSERIRHFISSVGEGFGAISPVTIARLWSLLPGSAHSLKSFV